jgi:hypothetical protein
MAELGASEALYSDPSMKATGGSMFRELCHSRESANRAPVTAQSLGV